MADFWSKMAADNTRFMRSKTFVAPASATYNVFNLPRYAFVKNVYMYISEVLPGTGTLSIGFAGYQAESPTYDVDYFMTTTTADAYSNTGFKIGGVSKWFNSGSATITVTVAQSTTAGGTFIIFADYTVIH